MELNNIDEFWNSANSLFKLIFSLLTSKNFVTIETWRNYFSLFHYLEKFNLEMIKRDWRGTPLRGCLHDTGATFAPERVHSVASHGSIFVYMIPPQNFMPAWVHPVSCTGARISLGYEISQRYHVNAKRPPVLVWNRSAGRRNGYRMRNVSDFESDVYVINMKCTFK